MRAIPRSWLIVLAVGVAIVVLVQRCGGFPGPAQGTSSQESAVTIASATAITRVDARTGQTLWTVSVPVPSLTPSLITIGSMTYVMDGRVYAIETATGLVRWQQEVLDGVHAGPLTLLSGTRLLVPTLPGLTALDVGDGHPLWHTQWMGSSARALVDVRETTVLATCGDGVCRIDAATGAVVWSSPVGHVLALSSESDEAVVETGSEDLVTIGLTDGMIRTTLASGPLMATGRVWVHPNPDGGIEVSTGTWQVHLAIRLTLLVSPVVTATRIVLTGSGAVIALDRATGQVIWTQEGSGRSRAVDLGDGHVLLGFERTLILRDAATGQVQWQSPLAADTITGALRIGSTLIVAAADGTVSGWTMQGTPRWQHDLGLSALGVINALQR